MLLNWQSNGSKFTADVFQATPKLCMCKMFIIEYKKSKIYQGFMLILQSGKCL